VCQRLHLCCVGNHFRKIAGMLQKAKDHHTTSGCSVDERIDDLHAALTHACPQRTPKHPARATQHCQLQTAQIFIASQLTAVPAAAPAAAAAAAACRLRHSSLWLRQCSAWQSLLQYLQACNTRTSAIAACSVCSATTLQWLHSSPYGSVLLRLVWAVMTHKPSTEGLHKHACMVVLCHCCD
jgi:hypothetical protein